MRYKVLLHRTDEGISVSVPGLPGCWSEGDTDDEALDNSPRCHSRISGGARRPTLAAARHPEWPSSTTKLFDNGRPSG
jgi:hypothetical protein